MANADRPNGAEPFGPIRREQKYVAGAVCYPGDLVAMQADGKVDPISVSTPGTDKYTIVGVCMSYASADGQEVIVADHPQQLIKIQADAADIAAQTNLGLNYSVVTTAGNSAYRRSRMELDSSSGAVTADEMLKVVKIDERIDNAFGANVDCICLINNHLYNGGEGVVGV